MGIEELVRALGARRVGHGWLALCPAHDDETPSLSLHDARDDKTLVHCHAGCDQESVISALRARGLWRDTGKQPTLRLVERKPPTDLRSGRDTKRTESALQIWHGATPAHGTLVETYLRERGITLATPDAIRFHPNLKHPSGGVWPAMIALVTRGIDGRPLAIHRTFLSRDGRTKAPVKPIKMMLGPCRGGAVRLNPTHSMLLVGEGLETCLAVMQATGFPTWAALSTSGLRTLDLPETIREVIVLSDGDHAGERAARQTAVRWRRQERRVRIAHPPLGLDFNDVLLGRTASVTERMR